MADGNTIHAIIGAVVVVLAYASSFWRIAKQNPDNRVIECGSITLAVFVVTLAMFKLPNIPDWIVPSLGLLVLLLSLLTILFLFQQAFHAFCRRKSK